DLSIDENKSASVGVFVNDLDTPLQNLTVTPSVNAAPSDLLVLALTGSGGSRTLTITPKANTSGSGNITLTVADPDGHSSFTTFHVTVNRVNQKPVISAISNFSINEDTSSGDVPFTVTDVEDGNGLAVTATSSDQNIIPNGNIAITVGTGANRTVKVTPSANA